MRTRSASPRPRALFITYTLSSPYAVGVFFRALRLAAELHARGWDITIWNRGPAIYDPKLESLQAKVALIHHGWGDGELTPESAAARFRAVRPDVVILGEMPFAGMEAVGSAAAMLGRPLVVLEQFYRDDFGSGRLQPDLVLLYGLRCFWNRHETRSWVLVPPFISEVAPKRRLAVPAALHTAPWIAVLGFEPMVLRRGIELAASLPSREFALVTVSEDPTAARTEACAAGIPPDRTVALPLQPDAELFGLISASAVSILANGFMQIMESLALGCPALCIHRGIGMDKPLLDSRFEPYVSLQEPEERQRERLMSWLAASPFPPDLARGLAGERDGAAVCADRIQHLWESPPVFRKAVRRVVGKMRSAVNEWRGTGPVHVA